MFKKKSIFLKFASMVMLICFCFTNFVFAEDASESKKLNESSSVIYITESLQRSNFDFNVSTVNPDQAINYLCENTIWIDDNLIDSRSSELLERYNSGLKTIIIGEKYNKNDIKKFLNLPFKNTKKVNKNDGSYETGTTIAYVTYKFDNCDIVANINAITKEDYKQALSHATTYDYAGLINKTQYSIKSSTFDWEIQSSDSGSVSGYGVTLSSACTISKDKNNPDSNDEYYFYSRLLSEARGHDNKNVVGMNRTSLWGPKNSKILDYGPAPQTVEGDSSVNVGLAGYGLNLSYTPKPKTVISKWSGGINKVNVEIRHQPKNFLGLNSLVSFLRSQAHCVSKNNMSSYSINATATSEAGSRAIGMNLKCD